MCVCVCACVCVCVSLFFLLRFICSFTVVVQSQIVMYQMNQMKYCPQNVVSGTYKLQIHAVYLYRYLSLAAVSVAAMSVGAVAVVVDRGSLSTGFIAEKNITS